jgi:hypothetical protein
MARATLRRDDETKAPTLAELLDDNNNKKTRITRKQQRRLGNLSSLSLHAPNQNSHDIRRDSSANQLITEFPLRD